MSEASLGKGVVLRPWKERDQSIWREPSSRIRGSSLKPDDRSEGGEGEG